MKIEIETKYNIGDVLYHVGCYKEIVKTKVDQIDVHVYKDNTTAVMYRFTDGASTCENFMDNYFSTPEEAGKLVARMAIESIKEK